MRLSAVVALLIFGGLLPMAGAPSDQELVERLRKAAQPDFGWSSEARIARRDVLDAGPAVIPYLLPLLSDDDERVRTLAAWTLTEAQGLSEEHLDVLIEAYGRRVGIIAPAIARVDSPRAAHFVVEALVRDGDTVDLHTAISILGAKAIPDLVQVYRTEKGWDDNLEKTMVSTFQTLHVKAKNAIGPLLAMANDESLSPKRRTRAIAALGAIAVSVDGEMASLQKLQKHKDILIRDAVLTALLFIRAGDAVERTDQICDLAAQGTLAKSSGPDLVKDLTASDWNVRAAAARALGYIGFEDATDALIPLLRRADDWRLVFCAAESLGRLRAEKAPSALAQIAKDHWYPPVRKAAVRAIKAIRDDVGPKSESPEKVFDFRNTCSNFESAGDGQDWITEEEGGSIRFPVAAMPNKLVSVAIKQGGARKLEEMRGVKVGDGYLVGSDRGEWGGEISYIDREGNLRVLAPVNTEAIYKTKSGIVAVTGLAHMGYNSGCLFRISKDGGGRWSAWKWRALPGAPRFSRLLQGGKLFISCQGGIVMVSPDGGMRSLTRQESL